MRGRSSWYSRLLSVTRIDAEMAFRTNDVQAREKDQDRNHSEFDSDIPSTTLAPNTHRATREKKPTTKTRRSIAT